MTQVEVTKDIKNCPEPPSEGQAPEKSNRDRAGFKSLEDLFFSLAWAGRSSMYK